MTATASTTATSTDPAAAPTPAAIYCRISKDRDGTAIGVDRQRKLCEELAERRNLAVVATFIDNDISASSGKRRKGYAKMLAAIKDGTVKAVVCWDTDRLHRRMMDTANYMTLCQEHRVLTHAVNGPGIDPTTPDGEMTAYILGSVAQREAKQTSNRIKAQKAEAIGKGLWLGHPVPFGLEVKEEVEEVNGRPVVRKYLVESEEEAAVVRKAVRDYLAGKVSLHGIARRWTEDGFTTRRLGQPWSKRGVVSTLSAEGMSMLLDTKAHKALVAKLNDPARRQQPNWTNKLRYMGSGFYRCGECGGPMAGRGTAGYSCLAHTTSLSRPAHRVDQEVRAAACWWLTKMNIKLLPTTEDSAPLREQLVELTAHAQAIARLLGDRQMTPEQFAEANAPVQAEIEEIQARLGRIEAASVLSGIADAPIPGDEFLRADVYRQRAVLAEIMDVTLLRESRGGDPTKRGKGSRFRPESVYIVFKNGPVYTGE